MKDVFTYKLELFTLGCNQPYKGAKEYTAKSSEIAYEINIGEKIIHYKLNQKVG
jgi:hypothetical protein